MKTTTVAPASPAQMKDGFGRIVEYLRISVTDKCNLRCVYCMPEEGLPWLKRDEILSYEEIASVVRVMAKMGLRRVRITGGEPLVRKNLDRLVGMLAEIPGIEDISLSTNAILLARSALALREAGLNRVNISLDSLRADRVDAIARRRDCLPKIMAGMAAAYAVGFDPIKVNVVLMRGRNEDEVADFAELSRDRPIHVRFIEVMPTDSNLDLSRTATLTCAEALERLREVDDLEPTRGPKGNGPASYYSFPGAVGTIGAITPMSHNFCHRCNRMRLTADGQLRPCLFGDLQTPLREALRHGEPLEPLIKRTLAIKPEKHFLERGTSKGSGGLIALSQTGG